MSENWVDAGEEAAKRGIPPPMALWFFGGRTRRLADFVVTGVYFAFPCIRMGVLCVVNVKELVREVVGVTGSSRVSSEFTHASKYNYSVYSKCQFRNGAIL